MDELGIARDQSVAEAIALLQESMIALICQFKGMQDIVKDHLEVITTLKLRVDRLESRGSTMSLKGLDPRDGGV